MAFFVKTHDGKEYGVEFQHEHFSVEEYKKGRIKAETTCVILVANPTNEFEPVLVVARGVAGCFASDQFNKEKGRKIALERALDSLFPRAYIVAGKRKDGTEIRVYKRDTNSIPRRVFWTAYFGRDEQAKLRAALQFGEK